MTKKYVSDQNFKGDNFSKRWKSKEHFENILKNPEAIPHMKKAENLAKFDPIQTKFVDSIGL